MKTDRSLLYLYLLVFTAGLATLGVELSAARLLDPWFGNSQIVWATLIGLILFYLAVGAWMGGRVADRWASLSALHAVVALAALGIALVPSLSPPVLRLAALGFAEYTPSLLAGSLTAVLALFSLPVILLGAVSPWALRLALRDLNRSGRIAGRLYACATAGSILGTFLPVLWLIPTFGTRWTFYMISVWTLLVVTLGALLWDRSGTRLRWLPLPLLVAVLVLALTADTRSVRAGWDDGQAGTILYEDESLYNYIAVRQWQGERHLKLNEGIGIHSVYHPDSFLSHGIWDYFALAPLFNPPPATLKAGDRALLIGLAAGTVSQLLTRIYGPVAITGVELDPQIIEVGRRYFAMTQPNLTAVPADGRRWLMAQPAEAQWDLIAVDAYRPPYIPFHLTTVEFFRLVQEHLSPQGVVAINVGRTDRDYALVNALAATLRHLFPSVHILDEPSSPHELANSLVVATMQETQASYLVANVAGLPGSTAQEFRDFARAAAPRARTADQDDIGPIFTDDRAPVEEVVHGIIWDFLWH